MFGGLPARSEIGLQIRHDRIRVGLFDTVARQVIGVTRDDQVQQSLLGLYGQTSVEWTPWLRSVLGLRVDQARFKVDSLSQALNSGEARDHLLSPKLSVIAGPWARTELFFNAGRGFHSNDARGTTARVDPRTGAAVDQVPGLVAATGYELGAHAPSGFAACRAHWRCGGLISIRSWSMSATPAPPRPSGPAPGAGWNGTSAGPPCPGCWSTLTWPGPMPATRSPTRWASASPTASARWPRSPSPHATAGRGRPACNGATSARARWSRTTACARSRRQPPTCASPASCRRPAR